MNYKLLKIFTLIILFTSYSYSYKSNKCNEVSKQNDVFNKNEVAKQPNIIVFLCDDLGYGDLSSYGSPGDLKGMKLWTNDAGLPKNDIDGESFKSLLFEGEFEERSTTYRFCVI